MIQKDSWPILPPEAGIISYDVDKIFGTQDELLNVIFTFKILF